MRVEEGFQQAPPVVPPSWSSDPALVSLLRRRLPAAVFTEVDGHLKEFEVRLAGPIRDANKLGGEPSLTQYDHLGQRVDRLATSEGWRLLKANAATEGFVHIASNRPFGEHSRLFSFAKALLWTPDCLYVGCPISMTDGCARVLELMGTPEMKRSVLPRLRSTDPLQAWTSGQWMTERPGGSDVSRTETRATPVNPSKRPEAGDDYVLDGFKWFSSATDGDVSLSLAQTADGLSLFLVKLRLPSGDLNGIRVHRLKKKWGTKDLPTAELELKDCKAQLVGVPGKGVSAISSVLNITRLWSAVSALSALRRAVEVAKSYATVRRVAMSADPARQGQLLSNNDAHRAVLASGEVRARALTQLVFGTIALLGKSEAQTATEDEEALLRLLTPATKAFTAEVATSTLLPLMETLGGLGYMEESGMGKLLQDATVERIWEGTQNVLALDVLRVIQKSKGGALQVFLKWTERTVAAVPEREKRQLETLFSTMEEDAQRLQRSAAALAGGSARQRLARPFLYLLASVATAAFLVEQLTWSCSTSGEDPEVDVMVLKAWENDVAWRDARWEVDQALGQQRMSSAVEDRLLFGGTERVRAKM